MKKLIFILAILFSCNVYSQTSKALIQVVKGIILDANSEHPLPNVTVELKGNFPIKSTITDSMGNFYLTNVPIGRITISCTSVGYDEFLMLNIEVTSSKQVDLEIKMHESIKKLNNIVIYGVKKKSETINENALISARQLNMDEAIRYSGTRNDPSRMAQNFAGVSGSNDARNDIVIRGNSPTGVLWRMDGFDIPNPNHFSTLGSTGGPISMLNTNTLKNSDFLTSAFPAQYGNAIAGVFDLRMRTGNNEKYEFTGGMGFNGFEFGAEGPIKKETKASFLFDYRYSMVSLIQSLGLNVGTGSATPYYQDLNFKLNIPTEHSGTFSFFGLGGESHAHFTPESQQKDNLYAGNDGNIRDRTFKDYTAVIGFSHQYFFNPSTYGRLNISISYFKNVYDEDIVEMEKDKKDAFDINYNQFKKTIAYSINSKLNKNNQFTSGINLDNSHLILHQDMIMNGDSIESNTITANEKIYLLKAFINLNHRFNNKLSYNLGLYTQLLTFNNTKALEPRWNLKYQMSNNESFSIGFGMHSQLQPTEVYFYKNNNGKRSNENLSFVHSIHYVLGYNLNIFNRIRFRSEVYCQYIYGVAVDSSRSSFSMLNEGAGFGFTNKTNLKNNGKGYNYGIELTLEKFLKDGYYYLLTGSIFNSKYMGSDQIWRNTIFNTNFTLNFLTGKEIKLNSKTTFGIDTKVTIGGGQRYTPFDVTQSQLLGYVVLKDQEAFSEQNDTYKRWDLKFTYTRNKKKCTQKWYLDLQNLTNNKNIFVKILNPKTGTISAINQIGFFPNFNYSLTF